MDPYETLETNGMLALFVNSTEPAKKEIPLDHYRYGHGSDDEIVFYRLYRVVYEQEKDGFSLLHSLYDWKEVAVKSHCKIALKQLCDSMKAAREFLDQPLKKS